MGVFMKKVKIFLIAALLVFTMVGCGDNSTNATDGKTTNKSPDNGIVINDVEIIKYDYGSGNITPELHVNITNNNDFSCDDVQLEIKALDTDGNIIDGNYSAWIAQVDSKQSGNAVYQFINEKQLSKIDKIEIYGYVAWYNDSADTSDGSYEKTHFYKIKDIPTKTIPYDEM